MRYAEAILICENIDLDSIGGREIDTDTNLDAIQKILNGIVHGFYDLYTVSVWR